MRNSNAVLAVIIFAGSALAQPARRPPQEPDVLSPEVQPDNRVTFRLRAPKATEVGIRGEVGAAALQKDEKGIWSVTLGPLEPDIYSYSFQVDGLTVIDPRNPLIKQGVRGSSSLVEVPAQPPAMHQVRDVPHGTVTVNWYKSSTLNQTRRVFVYTPPGYEQDIKTRYPILYLLHGAGDTEGEWTWVGRANLILDNLLAEGKARPMIIAMPFGHATLAAAPAERARNTSLFEDDLLKDVLPAVESKFRVAAGAKRRAIAGLSMGGFQSLEIGLKHLDVFGHLGVFSAGAREDFETRFKDTLAKPDELARKLDVFWIGIGEKDFLLQGADRLNETLKAHNVKHVYRKTEGAHTWIVWRKYLAEFLPLLFQK